ncbi:MAG: glycosyltransferase family 4 protein [Candidatus Binatia bacterium]|nr:glycosyltransferase family 4 protein [Candidatus Binatia bacterium]
MTAPVYLLVQGMYLRADSIAFDTAFQYRLFQSWGLPVQVFAERVDARNYPGINARPVGELAEALRRAPGPVIYHWVDGWQEGDELLLDARAPVVLRWHNNTPPWFFASYSPAPAYKTVRGFLELLRVADALPNARVWTNSEFSRRQLGVLGITEDRVDVVYPASAYLESPAPSEPDETTEPANGKARASASEPIRLLFVGRVVPHKGHFHLIAAAREVAEMSGREVRVVLPGRPDHDMRRYVSEVRALGQRLGVTVDLPGEVSHEELDRAYRDADVFVGLSEHEGFGLPILEAMTRHLPVVGYKCGAVAELLDTHPLAVDELDPVAIARRILAALDPAARCAVVDWQKRSILPRFSNGIIKKQLHTGLQNEGIELSASPAAAHEPSADDDACPGEVRSALDRALALPAPELGASVDLSRDTNPHFVTRYDLAAYHALLSSAERGDLRGRALAMEFGSHREALGGFMGRLKKGILRLQDGLVRTIEISHNDLEGQLRTMSDRVDALSEELKKIGSDTPKKR